MVEGGGGREGFRANIISNFAPKELKLQLET